MAEKIVNGVLKDNTNERNKTLRRNKGKYNGYNQQLNVIVGMDYRLYANEKNPIIQEQHEDILRYTHNGKTDFSQNIHKKYGVDKETLKYYSRKEIKPSYKVNDYDGYGDYISYMWDVYGMEESYVGHLAGLMNVRELAEDLAYDIVPSFEGKNAQDVINDILRYTDTKYAMEGDKVGIVRNINVANAVNGVITTNINNYSGKESKMGLISNRLYASTLLRGAQFNSLRGNKYITPELETLYGNNLSNVYNLSTLFSIDTDNGRIVEPDSGNYLGIKMPNGNIFDYLPTVISDFKLPELEVKGEKYNWSNHPNYGDERTYEQENIDNINSSTLSGYVISDNYKISTYSEGDNKNENANIVTDGYRFGGLDTAAMINNVELIDDIDLKQDALLSKTNSFLRKRKINTLISRFHDQDNKKIGLTQTSVSRFGVSHGRNLLTKNAVEKGVVDKINNYSNPYCRVWTAHHQFSKMKHLIRPFVNEENFTPISELQKDWYMFRGENGGQRLSDYGVLNKNGMVNITPTSDNEVDVKKCMFSIENLAWKDILTSQKGCYRIDENGEFYEDNEAILSEEQRGPNGGRIMWFPPYDLNFQETSTAAWSANEFIGRGEPVYTYTNSKRSGTLDFTILVDHPSVVNYWMLDKKRNATEKDEQTLLRYFAGCEAIDPNENIIELLNNGNEYQGPFKDPLLNEKEAKDIIFYTFFPNNYSGVDNKEKQNNGIKILFGGWNDAEILTVKVSKPTPFILMNSRPNQVIGNEGGDIILKYEIVDKPKDDTNKVFVQKINGTFDISFNKTEDSIVFSVPKNTDKLRYAQFAISYGKEDEIINYHHYSILQIGINGEENFPLEWQSDVIKEIIPSIITPLDNYFLGYEMGVNPLSTTMINYDIKKNESEGIIYFLDKIYGYSEAEKIFGDKIYDFVETLEINKNHILSYKNDNKTYYLHEYNSIKDEQITSSDDLYFETSNDIDVTNQEIDSLTNQISDLVDNIVILNGELNKITSGTTAYHEIEYEIFKLTSEKESLEKEKESKLELNSAREELLQAIDTNNATYVVIIDEIESIFYNGKTELEHEFNCSKPLYFCYNFTNEATAKNDSSLVFYNSPAIAYAKWKKENIKILNVDDITHKPLEMLSTTYNVNDFICKVQNKRGENKIWLKEIITNSQDIPYIKVKNKKEFIKLGISLGFCDYEKNPTGKKYFINHHNNILEFNAKANADVFITENRILPEITLEDFKKQNYHVAVDINTIANNKGRRYIYYDLKEITEEQIENEIINFLNSESQNSDSKIIKKYYENHKFNCLKEMGVGLNYGVIQFFYTGKNYPENGESYETVQDLIARHSVQDNSLVPKENDTKIEYLTRCSTRTISKEDTEHFADTNIIIEWEAKNPTSLMYPIDKKYEDQKLQNMNYYDTKSFGLNSTLEVVKKYVNPSATFSFGEVYAAIKGGDTEKDFVLSCERGILRNVLKKEGEELEKLVKEAEERIEYLKMIFKSENNDETLKIKEILSKGSASSHGNTELNKELSDNRGKSIVDFLKSFSIMEQVENNEETSIIIPNEDNNIAPISENNDDDVSSMNAKIGRCSRVTIVVGKKDHTETEKQFLKLNFDELENERRKKNSRRYDNERLFFEMLRENDNLAYSKLVDKVKYFSPAFHSITPEGFNARLTFLHQCTRQGPTATASDVASGTTAANLAFGRAPFCVLRLGDFLNTKIVIESISITYPDSQWDLNSEGIGVQFMMAKVSMQIHILGGSDISAPIKRLQNAVSFNYYANTSIYDNRSDTAVYTTGNIISNTKQWLASPKPSANTTDKE